MSKMKADFQTLFTGIDVLSPDEPDPIHIRGLVICGSCDLPAKAKFLNMKQYNGYYSCCKCEIKGEVSERTENCLAFPVDDSPLRKEADIARYAEQAFHSGKSVYGILGPTVLSKIVPFCFLATAIDVMHCVYEGITKRLMQLWFEAEFRNERFSLRVALHLVSDYVAKITPPSYIDRLPRSIVDHLAYWKASEFKAWILYYTIPIRKEIMSPDYFKHHLLFVCAIHLLNQDSVSETDIDNASQLLREYLLQFQILYGYKYVSMNFHLLLHLPMCVRLFGPCWTLSTFPFENFNMKLKSHVQGTRFAENQILTYLSTIVNVHSAVRELPGGSRVKIQGVPEHPSTPFFSRTVGPKFVLQKDLSGNRLRRI